MARCDLALTDGPLVASPTWTTVGRLISTNIRRGRRANEGGSQPGTAEIVLDDPTRALDPTNPGSAWAASLTPMRQMRIVQTLADGFNRLLFRGHVEEYTTTWRPTTTTTLRCVDALGYYASRRMVDAASWPAAVLADSPLAWYRLGEPSGARTVQDSSGLGRHGQIKSSGSPVGGFVAATPGAVVADPDGAIDFDKSGAAYLPAAASPVGAGTLSMEFFVRKEGVSEEQTVLLLVFTTGFIGMQIAADGRPQLYHYNYTPDPPTLWQHPSNINDAEWHHIVWTRSAANLQKVYVDGVVASTSSIPATTVVKAGSLVLDKGPGKSIDEVALYQSELSAARVAEHFRVARGRWGATGGHRSGTRMTTCLTGVLGATQTPVIDAGVEDVGMVGVESAGALVTDSAATHLDAVASVEGGRLFVTRLGVVTFRERQLVTPTPVATYRNDGGGLRFVHSQPSRRRADLVNHAEFSRNGGPVQIAESQASIAAHMRHDAPSRSGIYTDDFAAAAAASRAVYEGKEPRTRLDQLVVNTGIGGEEETSAALREIGDVVSVRLTPPSGSALDLVCVVEGISHVLEPGMRWTTTYDLSLAGSPQVPAASIIAAPDTALVSGAYQQITPYYEWFDSANMHSPTISPQWLVCRVAGDYLLTADILFSAITAGTVLVGIYHTTMGTIAATACRHNSGGQVIGLVSTVYRLAVGDTVELRAYQTSGVAQSAIFSAPYTPVLSAVRLG